jgi:hypothetical protein
VSDNEPTVPSVQVLRRFMERRPRRPAGEACDFCGEPIPDAHSHVVSIETRRMSCACRACYLLFTHGGAAQGKYRAVPDRYLAAGSEVFGATEWETLQIPVGVAFFFFNSALGRTVVFYPSPAGATESTLALDTWDRIVAASPTLRTLAPDVEALLVRIASPPPGSGAGGRPADCYVVPIDACYELVGRMRRSWRGFDGGDEARREVETFFVMVRQRCGLEIDAVEARS